MKVLVTGGAGFIGSHTVEKLLAQGLKVVVFDNFSSGSRDNLGTHPNLNIIEADIRDASALRSAMAGTDAVLHLAAQVSVQASIADPVASGEHNVHGFINILDASRRAGVKRFVYASSAAVYGIPAELPLTEQAPRRPLSPYGLEKMINEQYAVLFRNLYGYSSLGLRYFNVYGPRQPASSPYAGVIARFVAAHQAGHPLKLHGDGEQTRDYIYVGDVAHINMLAIAGAQNGVCNIGTGKSVSLRELIRVLEAVSGRAATVESSPSIAGDILHSSTHPGRQHEYFAYSDMISLEQGVRMLWESNEQSGKLPVR